MKIGVDASHYIEGNSVGTQVYLEGLLHGLSQIDSENEYIAYFKYPVDKLLFSSLTGNKPNFSFRIREGLLSWTQVDLASVTFLDRLDVLIAPWQTMPIVHRPKTKIVSVIHGADEFPLWRAGPTIYTSIFSNHVVAVSEHTKSMLRKRLQVWRSDVRVIPEGIRSDIFFKRSQSEVEEIKRKFGIGGKYIFFVGTLGPRKNILRMLKAFSKLVLYEDVGSDLQFVFAGHLGSYGDTVKREIQALKLEDKVLLLGKVPAEDLPVLHSGAQFLAYASISEGFGLPVLEAQSCGVPVLCSTTGALSETSGGHACLVDPHSVDEISSGMRRLLVDNSYVMNLVSRGKANSQKYSWQAVAQEFVEIFSKVSKNE